MITTHKPHGTRFIPMREPHKRKPIDSSLKNGIYTVRGTTGDDLIEVNKINGNRVEIKVNGKTVDVVAYDKIRSLHIYGRNGNDEIVIDPALSIDTVVWGGEGNDTIRGSGGNNSIHGGAGNDRLYGNHGKDTIYGGGGDDFIDGREGGGDKLFGGSGDDLIYGAYNNKYNEKIDGGKGNDTLRGGTEDTGTVSGIETVKQGYIDDDIFDDIFGEDGTINFGSKLKV
ncbi:MAG: hypothetical protein HY541_02105 [Deltaproteobacteria bacterium]|nr:hypothetical protein [Deltaproteobacteria bacterium]